MKPFAIETKELHVSMDKTQVLHALDLSIEAGRWTCVVGPNGAGKSTLLKALAGLIPSRGQLHVHGQALLAMSDKDRAKCMAWLGQQETGADDLSVRDLLMLGRLPHQSLWSGANAQDQSIVQAWIDRLQLGQLQNRSLLQLSGGERQRVLLGRALAVQAPILLMDEPIANVDIPHQSDWLQTVKQLTQQQTTVVSVLHDLNLAMRADQLVLMHQGRLVIQTSPDDPLLHQALIDVFERRLSIQRVAEQWVVLPI
jgi:iron complex transport system ATP-binding protein